MGVSGIHMVMEQNGPRLRSRFSMLGLVLVGVLTRSMTKTPFLFSHYFWLRQLSGYYLLVLSDKVVLKLTTIESM